MPLSDELINKLLEGKSPEEILGENGVLKKLAKRAVECALEAEIEHHLGYPKHSPEGNNSGNSRNGTSKKKVRSVHGEIDLKVPRDRNGDFEPQIIKKGERKLGRFDDRIISLYAHGMTTRDIQEHFLDIYGVDVSATFISHVTNEIVQDVIGWQQRPLDDLYPIVLLDALVVKSRASGSVQNKVVYLALGITREGKKELLGMWMAETEGAKFWLSVMTELKNRGVQRILVACTDGLKGFPEAIEAVFPKTRVQICIVHQVRHSLRYVPWKQRKAVADDLRRVYGAATLAEAEQALEDFAERWDKQYPVISKSWRNNWDRLTTFFDFPPEIRKIIYTTNPIESLNASLRKVTKLRRVFPNDEAVMKALYLAIHLASKKWTRPINNWKQAMNQFMIFFGDDIV